MIYGTFIREPREDVYRALVAALGAMAHRVLLVERILHTHDGTSLGGLDPKGERILSSLLPSRVIEEERSTWPGTRLLNSTALVREFTSSPDVIAALQSAVDGLYEWKAGLPEDLAFLRENGEDMMFAISHEEEAWLSLHREERDRLLRECPGINDCIEWRPGKLE
jgi:hypothetical protein